MSMEFKKYSSIENTYRKKTLDYIVQQGLSGGDWVVSEKVHGSNFSFWMDKEGLRVAKRSGFLSNTENFYGSDTVIEAYDKHLSLLYQMCVGMISDFEDQGFIEVKDDNVEVVLYGELFGGGYSHPDVDRVMNSKRVQKGVEYCPWNDFYAFDLEINGRVMAYDIFAEIMDAVGFHYAKALLRGTLEECLKFPNDKPTYLPEKFGLPEIENNVSEGVVIKPAEAKYFACGSRVMLKNKNDKFSEKQHAKSATLDAKLSEDEQKIVDLAMTLTNENRLRNVVSKVGKVSQKGFGKLMGELIVDILEDLKKEQEDVFCGLEDKREKVVKKAIGRNAAELLKVHFMNIIDETF